MTDQNTTPAAEAVERVRKALDDAEQAFWRTVPDLNYLDGDETGKIEHQRTVVSATAAIQEHTAYLWKRSRQPDVVEAAARALLAKQQEPVDPEYVWTVQFDDGREAARDEARTTLTAALTLLLGPRPEGARDE